MEKCVAVVSFFGAGFIAASNTSGVIEANNVNKTVVCAAGTTSLFGLVRVGNDYIPVSAEKFSFRLTGVQIDAAA
jgi:hypothetical protein